MELMLEGVSTLPFGSRIRTSLITTSAQLKTLELESATKFVISLSDVTMPLLARSRLPGDRMLLSGRNSSEKLQDIFVDRKIPRGIRDEIALVCDGSGRIIAALGVLLSKYAFAELSAVRAEQLPLVFVELE